MNAKEHYATRYHLQRATTPDNHWLYGYIAHMGVRSVFEFGCNMGRHLERLRAQGCEVAGMDINPRAVEAAKLVHGLEAMEGDEYDMRELPDNAYDLAFTVSVLSHMERPAEAIAQLRRIARFHVIMVETRSRTDAQNFWWSHDYPGEVVHSYYALQVNAVYQIWHLEL